MHSRLNDTQIQINLNITVAVALIVLGLALIGTSCFGWTVDAYADLGVAVVILGSLRMVAGWFCNLESRERNAFELGRDMQLHAELRRYDQAG